MHLFQSSPAGYAWLAYTALLMAAAVTWLDKREHACCRRPVSGSIVIPVTPRSRGSVTDSASQNAEVLV